MSNEKAIAMAKVAAMTMVIDLDDTICTTENRDYSASKPIWPTINKMREAREKGWKIIIHTARGQGRSNGDIESVREAVEGEVIALLKKYEVPYDEIIIGKPWAALYVDDKAMTPSAFAYLDLDEHKPKL